LGSFKGAPTGTVKEPEDDDEDEDEDENEEGTVETDEVETLDPDP
jgi:hypothetical protein